MGVDQEDFLGNYHRNLHRRKPGQTMTSRKKDKTLELLEALSGARFQESDITFEGTKLIIPEKMSAKKAIDTLDAYINDQEQPYRFSRVFNYRPWDGAAATERAIRKLTGTSGVGQGSWWAGPPQRISVQTGNGETLQVPWGTLQIALFEGNLDLGMTRHPELGPLFSINAIVPKKHKAVVEGFFNLIEEELRERSIYRGKAFDGQDMPEFLDLSNVDPNKVVYSDETTLQLDANIWALVEHTEAMRTNRMPLKRSVLLHGDYGTGKTLAAFLTAKKAQENDWTFIYCRPGKDNLEQVLQTARLYQPSVVFFEDIDTVAEGEDASSGSVTRLLDAFDGIISKGTEIIAILTTNHPQRIHKGMVRPGRLDAVIEFGGLDTPGIERMIGSVVPADKLGDNMDYAAIAEAMQEFSPAFVREAIDRTVRYSIARTGGEVNELCTEDFVHAANGLRPQLDLMNGAKEGRRGTALDESFKALVSDALEGHYVFDGYQDVDMPIKKVNA
jgi:transitional endoplasmic reticulum ATPase